MLLSVWLLLALLTGVPIIAHAQTDDLLSETDWREQRTDFFALLYVAGDEVRAQEYAAFVDGIYTEVTSVFAHQAATPVILRLYPTMELYYQANPNARNVAGVVAHANSGRREIAVALPQTERQTVDEVQNNVRHELAHLVIADMSDDRLNAFFHEGVAQYVEHPTAEQDRKIELLRQALDNDELLRWSDFDDRSVVYGQPQLSYPQSMSVVAFLVDRFGFPTLRTFLTTSARSSGYRSALERTYNQSPDALETEWRAWLPSYVEGGYQRSAVTSYDLSHVEELLRQGRYKDALDELNTAVEWLQKADQPDVLAQAQELRTMSADGQQAQELTVKAREALATADYQRVQDLANEARIKFGRLNDMRQIEILDTYGQRAGQGIAAIRQLADARARVSRLDYVGARTQADRALETFQQLGDETRAAAAMGLRNEIDFYQSLLGYGLLLLGLFGVGVNLWQRTWLRPSEVW